MMNTSTHRIRSQRWLVRASSQQAAFAIRQQLRSGLDTVLLPVFEHAFDTLGASEEVVHIPRLSLELKLRPDGDFIAALEQALREGLSEYLHAPSTAHERTGWQRTSLTVSRREMLLHYLVTGRIDWHAAADATDGLSRMLLAEASTLAKEPQTLPVVIDGALAQRIAIGFRLLQLLPDAARTDLLVQAALHTPAALPGRQPATSDAAVTLLPIALRQLTASGAIDGYLLLRVQALLLAIRNDDLRLPLPAHILALLQECYERAVPDASNATQIAILSAVLHLPANQGGSLAQRLAASLRLLQLLPAASRAAALAQAPLYPAAPLPEKLPATAAAAISLLPIVLRQLALSDVLGNELMLRVQAMLLALREEDIRHPLKSEVAALLHECDEKTPGYVPASAALHVLLDTIRGTSPLVRKKNVLPEAVTPTPAPNVVRSADEAPGDSAVYPASNAGLVLLHPFLPRLFDAVGITAKGETGLPEAMLPRAAAMLHWLASGEEEIYEFELAAIKVLLGLSPDDTLLVGAGLLDEAERTEADALLSAAISHWTALGQTSLAGFRHSFLQRNGLLRNGGKEWQLQVEPKPYDVLLKQLPWSISIVRLPWMTKPIFTDWPTL